MLLYNVSERDCMSQKNYASDRPRNLYKYADVFDIRRKSMKKITRIASIFLSLALIFTAAACGKDGSGASLSYPIAAQPDCLDPQIAQGAEAKTVVLNCFEGLVRKDAEGKYSPAAAKSWSYDASSLTYTFKLREDARWVIMKKAFRPILGDDIDKTFDSRVTAADFVFALRRAVSPATGAPEALSLGVIKNAKSIINGKMSSDKLGVQAVGDFELRITLESAIDESAFLDLLTKAICMPCNETFFNATKGRYGLDYSTLLCNGPFYLSYWLHDSALTIKNNDDYTGPFPAKPASVSLVIDGDSKQRLNSLLDGTYCAAQLGTTAPDSSDLSVTKSYYTVWALCFNCSDVSLSNVSLRRALCTAVDYNSLTLESEDMQKTYSIIPPACSVGEGADLNSEPVSILGYDMNRSAGYWTQAQKDLTGKLNLEIICLPEHENAMRRMIQGWQKVFGLSVNFTVTALDSATLSSRVQDGDYQIALTSMSAGITDAAGFLSTLTSQGTNNIVRLSDAQFDASVKSLKALSGAGLVKACRSAEGRLLSLGAVLPMFITPSYFATAKGVNGLSVDPESSAVDFVFVTAKD